MASSLRITFRMGVLQGVVNIPAYVSSVVRLHAQDHSGSNKDLWDRVQSPFCIQSHEVSCMYGSSHDLCHRFSCPSTSLTLCPREVGGGRCDSIGVWHVYILCLHSFNKDCGGVVNWASSRNPSGIIADW